MQREREQPKKSLSIIFRSGFRAVEQNSSYYSKWNHGDCLHCVFLIPLTLFPFHFQRIKFINDSLSFFSLSYSCQYFILHHSFSYDYTHARMHIRIYHVALLHFRSKKKKTGTSSVKFITFAILISSFIRFLKRRDSFIGRRTMQRKSVYIYSQSSNRNLSGSFIITWSQNTSENW